MNWLCSLTSSKMLDLEEQMARLRNQAQMNEIKSQLIKLVDEEIKGSQEELDFCDAYLARTGFKVGDYKCAN